MRRLILLGVLLAFGLAGLGGCGSKDTGPTQEDGKPSKRLRFPAPEDVKK
jgi:hypothetical protein